MPLSIYFLGRNPGVLTAPFGGEDEIFGGVRLDGGEVSKASFKHCTFGNVSFKESHLIDVEFEDCVFVACYFRKTRVEQCSFRGCRLVDCTFPKIDIRSSSFMYCKFDRCYVGFNEIRWSLPQEPNLREELCKNLALECAASGDYQQARQFRSEQRVAHKEHLKAALLGSSEWYKAHYDPIRRLWVAFQLVGDFINRVFWGYGERFLNLLGWLAGFTFLIFPVLFALNRNGLRHIQDRSGVTNTDIFLFSLENIVPSSIKSNVEAITAIARLLTISEALIGVVFAGLFVSYLFKRVNEQ
jgi:hypothetical protein